MIAPFDGFVGGSYRFPSARIGSQQALNMYPIVHRGKGVRPPYPLTFHPTPGTRTYATVGSGPIRDILFHDGHCFVISGSEYYRLVASGMSTKVGDILSTALPVKIEPNGTGGGQNAVMSGGNLYIHTLATDAFAQVTDPDLPSSIVSLAFADSYFLVAAYRTRQFNYSGRFNGLTWSAGDKAEKSQTVDDLVSLEVSSKEVWLFGSKTIEVWYNTGDVVATFAPIQGVLIEHGLMSPRTLRRLAGTLMWLGQWANGHGQVWMAQGYTPVRVSDDAVEAQWQTYGELDAAYAWTYSETGHPFYVITFPGKATWAYDLVTKLWHEMGYLNPETGDNDPHLGQCHAHAFGTHLVGSRIDGTIFELTHEALYDHDSDPIRRVVRSPHISVTQRPTTINRFEMRPDVGTAASSGQGSNPLIMLRYSVDGGRQYSDEIFLPQGAVGEYEQRVGVDRLGQGFDWVFEVSTSEPITHAWGSASVDIDADAG